MSLLAMPMLLVNLGCEMLYILDQRLKAQNIAADKSCRVLHDVVRTMFDPQFVEKMFTPQEMYSVSSTRKIFERLAHSSIMRLSESSMEKLFDLMLMGVKYQICCAQRLEQMVEVTQLHLDTIRTMMAAISDNNIGVMVNNVEKLMRDTYGGTTVGQLHLLRQTLQKYFQDKRVKVSLFLQEGIQSSTGRLILPSPVTPPVGNIVYYDVSGAMLSKDKITLKSLSENPSEFFVHPAPLGTNLYNKERSKVTPPTRLHDPASASGAPAGVADEVTSRNKPGSTEHSPYTEEYAGGKEARKELNLLTALLAIPMKAQATDNFKLNLFGDDDGPLQGAAGKGGQVLAFGDGSHNAYKEQVMSGFKNMSVKDSNSGGDDLLDLMDNA